MEFKVEETNVASGDFKPFQDHEIQDLLKDDSDEDETESEGNSIYIDSYIVSLGIYSHLVRKGIKDISISIMLQKLCVF